MEFPACQFVPVVSYAVPGHYQEESGSVFFTGPPIRYLYTLIRPPASGWRVPAWSGSPCMTCTSPFIIFVVLCWPWGLPTALTHHVLMLKGPLCSLDLSFEWKLLWSLNVKCGQCLFFGAIYIFCVITCMAGVGAVVLYKRVSVGNWWSVVWTEL